MKFLLRWNHQLILNAFFKGLSGIILFITISILIKYLGDTSYGTWVLIFTLFQWILYMDFGIANVLKTKIPELVVRNENALIGSFIKSSYKISSFIAGGIFIIITAVLMTVDLKSQLNLPFSSEFVNQIFLLNTAFFCVNFVLSINKSLNIGVLKTHLSEQSATVTQVLFLLSSLFFLFAFPNVSAETKLCMISISNGLSGVIVNFYYTFRFFRTHPFQLFRSENLDRKNVRLLLTFGLKFMVLQMLMIVIFSSDAYILASYLQTSDVSRYDIVTKYFQFPMLIVMSGMAYLWPMFAKKFAEKDTTWMSKIFRNFNLFFLGLVLLLVPFSLLGNYVLSVWVGKAFSVSMFFLFNVALMTAMRVYFGFYANFFNGAGNLKSQMILMLFGALFKIPLSIFLLKNDYSVSSVIIATNVFLLMCCIVLPIEASGKIKALKN
jgi:O-antigen/teichoic acid export membrane protein